MAAHHGRIVKRTGDGSIIEFRSVVDAVRCAIEVQTGLIERNAGVPAERRIEFRVGIHIGDVVEEADGDLMGDGVNIAARLEGLAKPGAICLSEDAYRQVKQRLDLKVSDLGQTQLKNIAELVRVYSLEVAQPAAAKPTTIATAKAESAVPAPNAAAWLSRWPTLVAALALALLAAGGVAWRAGYAPRLPGVSMTQDKLKTTPRLSIVVLPFENLSGDKEQDYFADADHRRSDGPTSRISPAVLSSPATPPSPTRASLVDARGRSERSSARADALEGSVRRMGREDIQSTPSSIPHRRPARMCGPTGSMANRSKLGGVASGVRLPRLANSLE